MRVLFLAIVLWCAAIPSAKAAEAFSYRNFIWGVSPADVRLYEKAPFYKEENGSLYFIAKPDMFRRMIRYDFTENKLDAIRYEIVELNLPNSGRIIDMAYETQKELSKAYGEPSEAAFFWKNRRYEKFPAYWGRALYSGDLRIQITWELPDTEIVMQTYYDGVDYQLFYTMEQAGRKQRQTPNAIYFNN